MPRRSDGASCVSSVYARLFLPSHHGTGILDVTPSRPWPAQEQPRRGSGGRLTPLTQVNELHRQIGSRRAAPGWLTSHWAVDMLGEGPDERQIPVLLGIVEPVADDKFV